MASHGLPFVILGGERGHGPLEAAGGEVVATLIVEELVSVVMVLSLFRIYRRLDRGSFHLPEAVSGDASALIDASRDERWIPTQPAQACTLTT
jgi:hypothetical protein